MVLSSHRACKTDLHLLRPALVGATQWMQVFKFLRFSLFYVRVLAGREDRTGSIAYQRYTCTE